MRARTHTHIHTYARIPLAKVVPSVGTLAGVPGALVLSQTSSERFGGVVIRHRRLQYPPAVGWLVSLQMERLILLISHDSR